MTELIWLRKEVLRLQLELEQERNSRTADIDLLMSGEALREQLMLKAILGGAFAGEAVTG